MTTPTTTIDLDAAKREAGTDGTINVILGGETFNLPAELPVDVFDPLLADDLDLVGIISDLLKDSESSVTDDVFGLLLNRPNLPAQLVGAIKDCFALLFGAEQYATFTAQRPSVKDYLRLIKGLLSTYGVSLGEAFASPASSANGGATANQTSTASTGSTPATPSAPEPTPASSESGDSARTS